MPTFTETTDAVNSTSTTYSMDTGDFFYGSLSPGSDSDWVAVTLEAGQTYTFAMVGIGATTDSLRDPYLRLHDSLGDEVTLDDDGGPGLNSSITYTPTSGGTYYLDAQSYNGLSAGDYALSMTIGSEASYDVTMGASNLIRSDASWSVAPGSPATVTWAIRESGTEPSGGNPFISPSPAQIAAIQEVMAYYDDVSGLNLTQVAPFGTSNNATMVFGAYSAFDGSGAYAYLPGSPSAGANAGDVWLNNTAGSTGSLPMGGYSYYTIIHEIGHALGLLHPGDYNAAPGVSITYGNSAQYIQDSHQYTVMSYFDEGNTASTMNSYPDTLMLYDLLALHQLYGADTTFHAGDTTYGFNATVGGAYDFTTNTDPFLSIWDGSGTDTLDLSGYTFNQFITLEAGQFSNVGGYIGNMSIAIGAVIENAIGGTGHDGINGNAANNTLSGGIGNDTLRGEGGNDTLLGATGNDVLNGGEGNDSLIGGSQEDALFGDNGNDTLRGDAGFDTLTGGAGDDYMDGGAQADNLYGNSGNDTMLGGNGFDRLFGQEDDDLLYGGNATDTLFGQEGNDTLFGQNGNDALNGGQGNDFLDGGGDDDRMIGGAGFDTFLGSTGNDTMTGAFNADTFVFADFGGGFGNDVITDFAATNDFERIDLSRVSAISDFSDLVANHMTQAGADVVIDDGSGNTITLQGVNMNDLLDGNDFIF